MTCRLLCVLLLAQVLGVCPAGAAPRTPAKEGLDSNLARAATVCEQAALRPPGAHLQLMSMKGIAIHDRAPRDLDVPDLVKRFAATQPMARLGASPSFHLHFLGSGGDVWALVYEGMPACSIMVTGASGDMPAAAMRLAEFLSKDGWELAASSPAPTATSLVKHILIKKLPKPATPDFGLMLSVRALAGDSADATGVQLEMRYLAGKLRRSSPDSKDVTVDVTLPPASAGTSSAEPK